MNKAAQLKSYTDLILSEDAAHTNLRELMYDIHSLFVSLGALDVIAMETWDSKFLENGKAISPKGAGLCLFEYRRTEVFLKGLVAAIRATLDTHSHRPVQVFDAGCGPYALLALLAAQYFDASDVQFSVLDIHEENISSARVLVDALGMAGKFNNFFIEDACSFQWPGSRPFDIVVTETMLNALRKEPQVVISLNLAKQLPPQGILIPEEIAVDFVMVHNRLKSKAYQLWADEFSEPDYRLFEHVAGRVITLNKGTSRDAITVRPLTTITIPSDYDPEKHSLLLQTRVTVFGPHVLQRNDTSITLPFQLPALRRATLEPGDTINFSYEMNNIPGITFETCNYADQN